MADIVQAAKWADEGNTICRMAAIGCAVYTNPHGVFYRHASYALDAPFVFTTEDILATDWEISPQPPRAGTKED